MIIQTLKQKWARASIWPAAATLTITVLAALLYSGHTAAVLILLAAGFAFMFIWMAFPDLDRIRRRAIREAYNLPSDDFPRRQKKPCPTKLGRSISVETDQLQERSY